MRKACSSLRSLSKANALFACAGDSAAAPSPPFPGTRRVTLPAGDDGFIGFEVFAGPGAVVHTFADRDCCAYFWGVAGHGDVRGKELLAWIVDKVSTGQIAALRQVAGMFIVLIDDRSHRRVRMISDIMGLRPWFIGRHKGRLVCGSDVWTIHDAGFNSGGVNYDAVASWLRFGYDGTAQSLFIDYPAIGPGVVATWENGAYSETPYAVFTGGQETPTQAQIVEKIHQDVSRAFDALTADLDHVTIALSGGYDSRYLAALASRRKHLKVEAFTVRDREAEGAAAQMVGDALGLSVEILRTDGTVWNFYDEPYHFTAGGFPMTKQTSYFAASQRPGVPCLNGFIGDPIVRGTLDRIDGRLEREIREDLAVIYQQHWRGAPARLDLLDEKVVQRCDERTLAMWQKHLKTYAPTGHPIFAFGMFVRQRQYISNNFLQHLSVSEALVPFVTWDVLQYKLSNDASCYSFEIYEALFRLFFPEIAHVPHNSKMGAANELNPRPSHWTKHWASQVLKGISRSGCMPLVNRRKSIPRLIGALMGRRGLDVAALFLYRLYMLEERLRNSGVNFDWRAI
jgi:Asparagine synthase